MAVDPYCFWCGRMVRQVTLKPGQPVPDDAATIDHALSKNNGRLPIGRWLLACRRCNQERNWIEVAEQAASKNRILNQNI